MANNTISIVLATVVFGSPSVLLWLGVAGLPILFMWWVQRDFKFVGFAGLEILRVASKARGMNPWTRQQWILLVRIVSLVAATLLAALPQLKGRREDGVQIQSVIHLRGVSANQHAVLSDRQGIDTSAVLAAASAASFEVDSNDSMMAALENVTTDDVLVVHDGVVPSRNHADAFWNWVYKGGRAIVLLGPSSLDADGWQRWRSELEAHAAVNVQGVKSLSHGRLSVCTSLMASPLINDLDVNESNGLLMVSGPTVENLVQLDFPGSQKGVQTLAVAGPEDAPLAVSLPVGQGKIVISAVPLSLVDGVDEADRPRWSDLPVWPAFLPFVTGLISEVAHQPMEMKKTLIAQYLSRKWLVLLLFGFAVSAVVMDGVLSCSGWWSVVARACAVFVILLLMIENVAPGFHREAGDSQLLSETDRQAANPFTVSVSMPPLCWPGEEIDVVVAIRGLSGQSIKLVLEDDNEQGASVSCELKRPSGTEDTASTEGVGLAILPWSVADSISPGACRLVLRAHEENFGSLFSRKSDAVVELDVMTTIVDGFVRVLAVDATPRFEYRFFLQDVESDPRFRVDELLLSTFQDEQRPKIDWSQYDVVWLGDVVGVPTGKDEQHWLLNKDEVSALGEQVRAGRLSVAWSPGVQYWRSSFALTSEVDWLPAAVLKPQALNEVFHEGFEVCACDAGVDSGWMPSRLSGLGTSYSLLRPIRLRAMTTILSEARLANDRVEPAIVLGRVGHGVVLGHLCETWRFRETQLFGVNESQQTYWQHVLTRLVTESMVEENTSFVTRSAVKDSSVKPVFERDETYVPDGIQMNVFLRHALMLAYVSLLAGVWYVTYSLSRKEFGT